MKIDRGLKTNILASLLAAFLFLYFLDPILGAVGRFILGVSRHLSQSYLDGLYRQMATGVLPKTTFSTFSLLTSLTAGLTAGMALGIVIQTRRRSQRATGD